MYKNAGEYLCKIMYKKNAWQREKNMKQKKFLGSFEPIKKMLDKSKIHIYTKNCIIEFRQMQKLASRRAIIRQSDSQCNWERFLRPHGWAVFLKIENVN